MIKSVLNNFWLAIHDNKLIVQIDDVIINHDNLSHILEEYFDGQSDYYNVAAGPTNNLLAYGKPMTLNLGVQIDF